MIEQALYEHLIGQADLAQYLTTYNGTPAVFNQEAPADVDALWGDGPQYGRIVFAVDIKGDPERTMGGTLAVDIQCKENLQFPEVIEPIVRQLIHGWFFSSGKFTVEAQWKTSSYFTQPTDKVTGCTIIFDLLAFPLMTTGIPDVIGRINEWTSKIEGLSVINYDELPAAAWKPEGNDSAVYWRLVNDKPAVWIPDTFQTIWRTATIKCHIFSSDHAIANAVAQDIVIRLYAAKRLMKDTNFQLMTDNGFQLVTSDGDSIYYDYQEPESPIMVNQTNTIDSGADPLRTGQVTVEATYGVIVYFEPDPTLSDIEVRDEGENSWLPITENP
jgi:hypothetical protein